MTNDPFPPPTPYLMMVDDLLDAGASHLPELVAKIKRSGRRVVEFNFNTTDVIVDVEANLATVTDILNVDAEPVTASIETLLGPFQLVDSLSTRCVNYIKSQFAGNWKHATGLLAFLPSTDQNLDRMVTAAVVQSNGSLQQLAQAVSLARIDWRDMLMNAGRLAYDNWPTELDTLLADVDE